jgi:hypothetical protein
VNVDREGAASINLAMEHIELEETRRENKSGVWPQYRHISGPPLSPAPVPVLAVPGAAGAKANS